MSTSTTATKLLLKPVVICGPSGVGKGTLINMLMNYTNWSSGTGNEGEDANNNNNKQEYFGFSVSHTTRLPRDGEINGIHYNFTSVEQIQDDIANNKFIEYAEVHGKYYGTSIAAVQSVQEQNKICILDIDIQGVQKVKESTIDAYYIFISPPSYNELEKRLRGRNTESEESIQLRLTNAKKEMEYGTSENFNTIFINNDLQTCFNEMKQQFLLWYPQLLVSSQK